MTGSPPKRQKSEVKSRRPSEKTIISSRAGSSRPGSASPPIQIPPQVPDTADSRALCYFFTQYIQVAPQEEKCKSYVDHLVPLYLDSKMSMRLYHATSAVSMLTLAQRMDREKNSYVESSRVKYGKAVSLLREAVADPSESRTDDTLMTALILGLYDSIAANADAPFAWRSHVDGAFAMVNLRTHETLTSPLSQKLYWAVKSHSAISHVMRCEPMDPFLDWTQIWKTKFEHAKLENYAYIITLAALRLPALRHAATHILSKRMTPETALDVLRLLGNVKVLDAELACWPYTVPAPWRPTLVGWKHGELLDVRESDCYPGPVWGYYNWWIANVWNMYRALRCYCQGLVQSCVERLLPPDIIGEVAEYIVAVRIQQRMVDEICASVPICLGDKHGFTPLVADPLSGTPMAAAAASATAWTPYRTQDDQGHVRSGRPGSALHWPRNPMSGYFLIWNLETAASIPTIPAQQRSWLLGRLEEVERRFGIGVAGVTATEVRRWVDSEALGTATHIEVPAYTPYPDLEILLQQQQAMTPDTDRELMEIKVDNCIEELAQRYSEYQEI